MHYKVIAVHCKSYYTIPATLPCFEGKHSTVSQKYTDPSQKLLHINNKKTPNMMGASLKGIAETLQQLSASITQLLKTQSSYSQTLQNQETKLNKQDRKLTSHDRKLDLLLELVQHRGPSVAGKKLKGNVLRGLIGGDDTETEEEEDREGEGSETGKEEESSEGKEGGMNDVGNEENEENEDSVSSLAQMMAGKGPTLKEKEIGLSQNGHASNKSPMSVTKTNGNVESIALRNHNTQKSTAEPLLNGGRQSELANGEMEVDSTNQERRQIKVKREPGADAEKVSNSLAEGKERNGLEGKVVTDSEVVAQKEIDAVAKATDIAPENNKEKETASASPETRDDDDQEKQSRSVTAEKVVATTEQSSQQTSTKENMPAGSTDGSIQKAQENAWSIFDVDDTSSLPGNMKVPETQKKTSIENFAQVASSFAEEEGMQKENEDTRVETEVDPAATADAIIERNLRETEMEEVLTGAILGGEGGSDFEKDPLKTSLVEGRGLERDNRFDMDFDLVGNEGVEGKESRINGADGNEEKERIETGNSVREHSNQFEKGQMNDFLGSQLNLAEITGNAEHKDMPPKEAGDLSNDEGTEKSAEMMLALSNDDQAARDYDLESGVQNSKVALAADSISPVTDAGQDTNKNDDLGVRNEEGLKENANEPLDNRDPMSNSKDLDNFVSATEQQKKSITPPVASAVPNEIGRAHV